MLNKNTGAELATESDTWKLYVYDLSFIIYVIRVPF